MNIVLWILQVLLAAEFVFHGWIFLFPPADLVDIMDANLVPWFRIFLGVAEWLGAAGLILPGITRMMPWLTPLAALGLTVVVGSATVYHLSRGEISSAIMTAVLTVLCAFVAYMRWRAKPITGPQIA
ncbi:MAG: DoxX family protein [Anaerolineae bacterium]|nr:DoxX family protein [Anaerolineales bacterium]MCQ3979166.1 DoxX family protein [Anaerolineae bacterium]